MDRLHQIFAHFICKDSNDDNEIKVLAITLSFFSLMMSQDYNALVHTDLVTPVVPDVPHSYQDFAFTVSVIHSPKESSTLKYFN